MNPTICPALDDYLAHDLSEVERSAFEAHLATCPECRATVRENRRLDALLGEAVARLRPIPETLPGRIRLRLDRARRNRRAWAGAALVACLIAIGTGFSLRVRVPPPTKEVTKIAEPPKPESVAPPAHAEVRFAAGSGTIAVPVASDSGDFTFIQVYKGLRDLAKTDSDKTNPDNERNDP